MIRLTEHINRYPMIQLQDVLKLHLQGILGPNHLKLDEEKLRNNLNIEYKESLKNDFCYEMIEEISDNYVRVYIRPYFRKMNTFDYLIKAFFQTIKLNASFDQNKLKILFEEEVRKLINDNNKEVIIKYLESKKWNISHSDIYKKNYYPHYLVINKIYLEVALNEK